LRLADEATTLTSVRQAQTLHALTQGGGYAITLLETHPSLLTAARELHVQAQVKGDLAAAGERITIDGPIDGYVMSAGRTVTLDWSVGNDLWAAGETIAVNSDISNNAMLAGRTVHLESGALVGHDARIAGDTVTTEGRVERN
jgi:hypothetical protein